MSDRKFRTLVELRTADGTARVRFLSQPEPSNARPGSRATGTIGAARESTIGSDVSRGRLATEEGISEWEYLMVSIAMEHMRSYLDLCARNDLSVLTYRDDTIGTARESDAEHGHFQIILRPRLVFAAADLPAARAIAIRLNGEALGQSVFYNAPRIAIEVEPVLEFREPGQQERSEDARL